MEKISKATGGEFRYVPTGSLRPMDSKRFLASLKQIERVGSWKKTDGDRHRERDLTREFQTRLSIARDLISDGELLYAEYIMRPLYHAPPSSISNPTLLHEVLNVLNSEAGDAVLEDFEQRPEMRPILAQ
jgi:hypothetical protein